MHPVLIDEQKQLASLSVRHIAQRVEHGVDPFFGGGDGEHAHLVDAELLGVPTLRRGNTLIMDGLMKLKLSLKWHNYTEFRTIITRLNNCFDGI